MEPLNDDELTRDVYAHFGLAYYLTECVHRALMNAVALLGLDQRGATRPRVEELMKAAERSTFGELVPRAKEVLPVALHASLDWALAKRNFLAHGFWYERIHMMTTAEGMRELIAELQDTAAQFRELNRIMDDLTEAHLRSLGLGDEAFARAWEESTRAPPSPLPNRKIPRIEERITIASAWVVHRKAGRAALVLQDASGERWQLCDAGLGWCDLDAADGAWELCDELVLPAQVVARPKNARSWNYKLHVSTGALICIELDSSGVLRWRIEPARSVATSAAGSTS